MADTRALRPSLVAVDTKVLMDMAHGHAPTIDAMERCAERPNLALVVTPTVVHELAWGAEHWDDAKKKASATKALTSLLRWKINPLNLKPVGHGICEAVSVQLARRGYLPAEERNDAFVLVEAALCGAKILVTWDGHLSGIPTENLAALLTEFHLAPVLVTTPAKINRLFR
jgi:rRNA-processing protein FCF1